MKKTTLLKTMLLLCALVGGTSNLWGDDYELYSGTITEGDYIIVYDGVAMKNTVTSDRFDNQAVTISENKISNPAAAIVWHIAASGDYWTIYNAAVSKYAASTGAKNKGQLLASGTDDKSLWTVSGTSTYEFVNKKNEDNGVNKNLRRNGTNGWACYSTSTGGALSLYKKVEAAGEVTTVTINPAGITNTNKFISTAAGTLTASVTYGSPAAAVPEAAVTWESSNTSVATVGETTGVVTLVGEGSTTITATYAGKAGEYKSSSDEYVLNVTNEDPDAVIIWSENFSSYKADDVPSGGTYNYSCTNGGSTTKIYAQGTAGGVSPELLVSKTSGTFSATIPLLTSTYGYSGNLVLRYKTNATALNVKTTTDDISVDGEENEGDGVTYNTAGEHKVTFKGITTLTENITIVFTATTGSNVRLDDIVLKGTQAALTKVATPVISPASGAVASGTEVTITCATDGVTIYYTTDGSTPTSSSTAYNPASKPTITAATTIKAIAVKDGLTDSEIASASYTIAAPCATPTFSVPEGEVVKGTTVTLSTATDGATIYYTTDGTTPTTGSSVFSSAITINSDMTIKAIAVKDGMANSEVAEAAYTVLDYATLPFAYDGNGLGVLPSGLTQNGLTDKYNTAPKMKFDNTGDYLILKLNEAPKAIAFDIKGNGFSGGDFKVQASADGSSYSDLATFTELGDQETVGITGIDSDVRYIKWIYTTKSSGNVALGNINAYNINNVSVTFAASGYASYCSPYALDLTPGVGYAAWAVTETSGTTVTFTKIPGAVPAGTPFILYGETKGGETINLPFANSKTATVASNMLKGTLVETPITTVNGDYTNFGLSGGKFVKINDGTLPANKAYLPVLTSSLSGETRLAIVFENETTGISSIENGKLTIDNSVYNLNGQKVEKPGKGMYIMNGKKVIFK